MKKEVVLSGALTIAMSIAALPTAQAEEAGDIRFAPLYGDINPFYGDINPFYGDINPFYGDINPFWGDISPFWGDISPFYGDISPFWGDIAPFWGDISPFWGDIAPFWGDINAFWGDIAPFSKKTQGDYDQLGVMMNDLYTQSEAFWGDAVAAKTNASFWDGFAGAIFDKYGMDLGDPKSFDGLDAAQRSNFFLDWYDGLMGFSGMDHVDHWMPAVNWSPSLSQDQGMGERAKIGLLDMRIGKSESFEDNIEFVGGYEDGTLGHGAAVASLIVSPHDGEGIMGIAPSAKVLNYNPFDETNTASWEDVKKGIDKLGAEGASVINISLGVPGWTLHGEWANILSEASTKYNPVFVKAAGNEGISQSKNINWFETSKDRSFEKLIVVGSVDPNGEISAFSNTPGEACLHANRKCRNEDKLKYRFMVAPGELLLVSDGDGGVTRMSGTSFAAPLVSGAITLLHDRWPWLRDYAEETVDIMFQSAQDLGKAGVDSVYGWGLLDVEASQSPLSFDDLVFYQPASGSESSDFTTYSAASFKKTALKAGTLDIWQAEGAAVYAMEDIGETHRDFAIPLSTLLYGETTKFNDNEGRYQRHVQKRLVDWVNGVGFSDIHSYAAPMSGSGNWYFGATATPLRPSQVDTLREDELDFHSGFVLINEDAGFEIRLGQGEGAVTLSNRSGFGFYSDYDVETGGVNPLIGFASGGSYVQASLDILENVNFSMGYTERVDDHTTVDAQTGQEIKAMEFLPDYEASAITMALAHDLNETLTVNVSYARLREETGFLGAQGSGALGLSGGTDTDSFTLGFDLTPSKSWKFAASATLGKTHSTDFTDSNLSVSEEGVRSSAFALAAQKLGVFAKHDSFRFSFMQPLHVERGSLDYTSVQVIDRQTGELGIVTDSWSLSGGNREYIAETLYATPILDRRAEISFFGQLKLNARAPERSEEISIGSRFTLKY